MLWSAALCIVGCLTASQIKLDPRNPSPAPKCDSQKSSRHCPGSPGVRVPLGGFPCAGREGLEHETHLGGLLHPGWRDFSHFRMGLGQAIPNWLCSLGPKCLMDSVSLGCAFFLGGDLSRDPRFCCNKFERPYISLFICHLWSSDVSVVLGLPGARGPRPLRLTDNSPCQGCSN